MGIEELIENLRVKKSQQTGQRELELLRKYGNPSIPRMLDFLEEDEMKDIYGKNILVLEILAGAPSDSIYKQRIIEHFDWVGLNDKVSSALLYCLRKVPEGIARDIFIHFGRDSLKYLAYARQSRTAYQERLHQLSDFIESTYPA